MKSILDEYNKLDFSCLKVEVEKTLNGFKEMFELGRSKNWVFSSGPLDFRSIYFPEPRTGGCHLPRFVIWEPRLAKGTSVYMCNISGTASSWINAVTGYVGCDGYHTSFSIKEEDYPFCVFHYYSQGELERVVYSMKEEKGWSFYQKGRPLKIEEVANYKRRKIVDRINQATICGYFSKLGWDITNPVFWQTDVPAVYAKKTAWSSE